MGGIFIYFAIQVRFTGGSGDVTGSIYLSQVGPDGEVEVRGALEGLSRGQHGFHVHMDGKLGNGCKDAGGHYNPLAYTHSSPSSPKRHVGDLGNVEAGADGRAEVALSDGHVSLFGGHGIVGRAFVVHAGEDDLGEGGDEGSKKTGNAGGRVTCGVVELVSEAVEDGRAPQEKSQPLTSGAY